MPVGRYWAILEEKNIREGGTKWLRLGPSGPIPAPAGPSGSGCPTPPCFQWRRELRLTRTSRCWAEGAGAQTFPNGDRSQATGSIRAGRGQEGDGGRVDHKTSQPFSGAARSEPHPLHLYKETLSYVLCFGSSFSCCLDIQGLAVLSAAGMGPWSRS